MLGLFEQKGEGIAFIFDGENSHFLTGAIPLTVVLIFFVIASTLRFSIGMSEEYQSVERMLSAYC